MIDQLYDIAFSALERRKDSSAIPGRQQPMCRYPDLVERPSPSADAGTAGVSNLESRERAELVRLRQQRREHEQLINKLWTLLPERADEAMALVMDEYYAIHGQQS